LSTEDAINAVREVRSSRAIENQEQLDFIEDY